jgi:trimeric autotransporter adhesin
MTWFYRILRGLRTPPSACLLPAVAILTLCSQPGAWSQQATLSSGQQSVSEVPLGGRVTAKGQPLAEATVTVVNPVSGASLTALTDASGAWSLPAVRRGVYLVRAEKEGYSPFARQQSVPSADQEFDCSLLPLVEDEPRAIGSRALASLWPTVQIPPPASSSLNFNLSIQQQTAAAVSHASVSIPSFAGDPYFSDDSFSLYGQADTTIPYLIGGSLMENDFENGPEMQNATEFAAQFSNMFGSGPAGGGFGALLKAGPESPHGLLFWNGGNSVLNARPFVLAGQPNPNPNYSSNSYGGVWSGHPMFPGLRRQSKRDFVLLTYSGVMARSLVNSYGLVPTSLERQGNFSQLVGPTGQPVSIYPPQETNIPYPNNIINTPLNTVALAILSFLPEPNLSGSTLNYHLLTTQGTHLNAIGARYNHSFGAAPAAVPGLMSNTGGLTQNFALNFAFSHQATDVVDLFPQLGGKQFNQNYALTATHTIGKGNWIANFAVTSIRSDLQVRNFFTGADDVATRIGLQGFGENAPVNANRFNYGLPNLIFSGFSEFAQTQPASILNQSFGVSGSSAWLHGRHLIRTGIDARRIELNLFGGTDATGSLIFTGKFTQQEGLFNTNPVSASGSSLADFLLGIPQEVMIESPNQKAYMRQNDWQAFVRDDWRVTPTFTLLAGLRYNYFSPYAEKYDRLSTLDYVPGAGVPLPVQPNGIGPVSGAKYPRTLIYPERNNFSPHLGFAWQGSSSTAIRAGYGIYYTVGQYGSFIQSLAYQPPFANTLALGNTLLKFQEDDQPPFYAPLYTLADAFNVQAGDGNYAINRHYRLPYIQFWSASVEQTLPLQIVIDASYTGAKGTRLDTITAPGLFNQSSIASLFFDYQDSTAFSNFNALTVTATKRLQNGLALSATYIYSHAIDNAASINAGSPVVAQDPYNILAEEGNSNFDIRHQFYGSFFYELPFGPNMPFLSNSHWVSRIFGDWSLAGTFAAASGLPLTPYIAASAVEVARGTHGSVRPNRNFGVPLMAGGGHLTHWFNTKAFSTQFAPGQLYGTASRNSIPGPGLLNVSASLSKTFLIREGNSLELRCTAANVFNAVQYSAVNTQFDSPTVGQVTATQPMRQLTFLGRFRF